jgi:hypothetical protein
MNAGDSVFKSGNYEIFPDDSLFSIYHIAGLEAELMVGDFLSLDAAIDYLLHP